MPRTAPLIGLLACTGSVADPPSRSSTEVEAVLPASILPPPPSMTLSTGPWVIGYPVDLAVTGAPPSTQVHVKRSANLGGAGACLPGMAPECLDIGPSVRSVGSTLSDASGDAAMAPIVPPTLSTQVEVQAHTLGAGAVVSDVTLVTVHASASDGDADGLTAGDEVAVWHTDPELADTDGGGAADGDEVAAGTSPLDPLDDCTVLASCPAPIWLYAVREADDVLERIDANTGVWDEIGPLGVVFEAGDLAYDDATGTMYLTDGHAGTSLYTVDLASGAATLVVSHGVADLWGLAWDPDLGTLWATGWAYTEYAVDPVTGWADALCYLRGAGCCWSYCDLLDQADKEFSDLAYDTTRGRTVALSPFTSALWSLDARVDPYWGLLANGSLALNGGSPAMIDGSIAYDSVNDWFWVLDWVGNLWRIDPKTGYSQTLYSSGHAPHDGLVFVP